jgi:3-deoxy-D-manno-octulosonate 8-phosphate phosphatase (KDO 8-P phosphatase)
VTDAAGGHGAVREAAEFILAAQGKLESLFAGYLDAQ